MIESGAGAPQLLGASLPAGKTGPQVCAQIDTHCCSHARLVLHTMLAPLLFAAASCIFWAAMQKPVRKNITAVADCASLHYKMLVSPLVSRETTIMPLQLIRDQMDAAVAKGFTVMRAWSHGVTPNYALQTSPGVYNEAMFRGLDYALDEAAKRNIKVAQPLLSDGRPRY